MWADWVRCGVRVVASHSGATVVASRVGVSRERRQRKRSDSTPWRHQRQPSAWRSCGWMRCALVAVGPCVVPRDPRRQSNHTETSKFNQLVLD
jgi:hypothetical protein